MIHAIEIEDGRASYRNRWVESDGLKEERKAGHALYRGIISLNPPARRPRIKVTGNTNIVSHAGKLLALVESSLPTEMVPCTLATVGLYDFGGKLGTRHDRASEDGSRNRRDAVLRLRALPAVPDVPRRRPARRRSRAPR